MEPELARLHSPEYLDPIFSRDIMSRTIDGEIVRERRPMPRLDPTPFDTYAELKEKIVDPSMYAAASLPKENWMEEMLRQDSHHDPIGIECDDRFELSPENILHTIAKLKNILNSKARGLRIKYTECYMTPQTKDTLVRAAKRLKQYGKKSPIIKCYDEYGVEIGEKIDDELLYGMTLNLVSPEKYNVPRDFIQLKVIPY